MDKIQKLYNQVYYESKIKPKRQEEKNRNRSLQLQKKYGITITVYNRMLEEQKYKCAICEAKHETLRHGLVVDHCHRTNEIRGLLCNFCNTLLGMAQDNPLLLQSAIQYLCKSVT